MTIRLGVLHAVGILAAFLLGALVRSPPEIVFLETPAPEAPAAAPALIGRCLARGASAADTPPDDARPDDEALPVEAFLPSGDLRTAAVDRSVRGLLAAATLHALAGKVDAAEDALQRALQAGATTSAVIEVCALLPDRHWTGVLDTLRAVPIDEAWDPLELAQAALHADATNWAWQVLERALDDGDPSEEDVVEALFDVDARRTAAFLVARLRADPDGLDEDTCFVIQRWLARAELTAERRTFTLAALAAHPFHDGLLDALEDIDPAEAEAHAHRRLRERPEDLQAWRTLASVLEDRGDEEGARAAYLRIAEIRPDRRSLRSVLAVDAGYGLVLAERAAKDSTNDEIVGTLAEAYIANDLLDAALKAYLRANALDPTDYVWLRALHELDAERAEAALRLWAATEDASDEILGAYGHALLGTGRAGDAFTHFARAIETDDDDAEWFFGLAEADPTRAGPVLAKLVEENPACNFRSSALGMAMAATKEREAGLKRMESAAAAEPCYRLYSMLCKADEARGLAVLRAAMKRNPENDEWYGVLGEVHARRNETTLALAAYEKAFALDPDDPYWRRRIALLRAAR